ncbi:PITH domain-containing protein, partial [Streptococcus suis]|uniref:PITH domain-containing protein n=1 Tax=Streptococcus suis TaxID=1307 RepID=UPI003CE72272
SLESVAATNEVVEYPLRPAKFSRVRDVTLYIPASQGAETSRIYFVGFKGEWDRVNREAPAGLIYESAP